VRLTRAAPLTAELLTHAPLEVRPRREQPVRTTEKQQQMPFSDEEKKTTTPQSDNIMLCAHCQFSLKNQGWIGGKEKPKFFFKGTFFK
jgi:hypothetical protein